MRDARTRADATSRRILDAALDAFVLHGYSDTSTDQIAAGAAASKQTVYKYFGDKEGLFRALTEDIVTRARSAIVALDIAEFRDAEDAVRGLARQFAQSILDPRVQRIRRLVIAEAVRFPDVGRAYYDGAFGRTLESVGDLLAQAGERGWLRIEDPELAANHLAGLLLWLPSNRIMMTGRFDAVSPEELEANLDAGVRAFLAVYRA